MRSWASECTRPGFGGTHGPATAGSASTAHQTVLVDRRGAFTFCVDVTYRGADDRVAFSSTIALRADAGPAAGPAAGRTMIWINVLSHPVEPPAADRILVLNGDLTAPPTPDPTRTHPPIQPDVDQVSGLAGSGVTGVDLVLRNGVRVTATVSKGLWGAWFPRDRGDLVGSHLEIHTDAGTTQADTASLLVG